MSIFDRDFVRGYKVAIRYKAYDVSVGDVAHPNFEVYTVEHKNFCNFASIENHLDRDWNKLEVEIESTSGCEVKIISSISVYRIVEIGKERILSSLLGSAVESHNRELQCATGIAQLTLSHIKYLYIFAEKLADILAKLIVRY